jgi:hypothetical protein
MRRLLVYLGVVAGGYVAIWVLVCLFQGSFENASISGYCAEHGYPDHTTLFDPLPLPSNFHGVCRKRVNGTDVMVTTTELGRR